MAERLIRWFVFSVLVALLPFVWNWISLVTQEKAATLETMFCRGELFLVSCALCAAALGELIGTGRKFAEFKLLVGFGCLSVLMLNSLWFSQVSFQVLSATKYDTMFVTEGSLMAFMFTVLVACGALLLVEAER